MAGSATHRDPLAPRWLACTIDPPRAGTATTARVVVENAGSATWRSTTDAGIRLAYHWLDRLGNPIVWDGERTLLPEPLAPGATLEIELPVTAPRPPGSYRLEVDLVEEHRFWLEELGCTPIAVDVEVRPRIDERRLVVVVHGGDDPRTTAALAAQDEPVVETSPVAVAHLVTGAEPEPGWSRLLLDAHAEGYAVVGPAIAADRRDRESRTLGARRWPQPAVRRAAPAAVAPRRARAVHASRAAVVCRRRCPLRGPRRRQASDAIRSSTRLNTKAPSARATTASPST